MHCGVSVVTFHEPPSTLLAAGLLAQAVDLTVLVRVNEVMEGEVAAVVNALERLPDLRVVAEDRNTGFSGGHNRNCAELFAAGHDVVLVLNPDVQLRADALLRMITSSRDCPSGCLVGPLLELAEGRGLAPTGLVDSAGIIWTRTGRHLDALQGRPLSEAATVVSTVDGLTGACLLVTRAAWESLIGQTGELFDEDFVAYREDAELGLRARSLGIPMLLEPSARALHGRRLRGTSRDTSAHINRLGVRNRFLLAAKHGRHRPGNPYLSVARDVTVVLAVLLRERSSLPGLRDALRLLPRMRLKHRQVYRAAR